MKSNQVYNYFCIVIENNYNYLATLTNVIEYDYRNSLSLITSMITEYYYTISECNACNIGFIDNKHQENSPLMCYT